MAMAEQDQRVSLSGFAIGRALLAALARVIVFVTFGGLGGVYGQELIGRKILEQSPSTYLPLALVWCALHIATFALLLLAWPTVRRSLSVLSPQRRWQWQTLISATTTLLLLTVYALVTGVVILAWF